MELWNIDTEIEFFKQALKNFATPEQLFYKLSDGYFAYIQKNHSSENQTLQSRNSLIGQFTEKWCKDLLEPIARKLGLYVINGMVCDEIGLSKQSSADVAFCTKKDVEQKAENVKMIFEVKMSIASNYQYFPKNKKIEFVGDYKSHKGQPSLQRSDSMLKAIGKSINIRVSGLASTRIPIIIVGNSPITDSYCKKVDYLKTSGVIQNFISVFPNPTESDFVVNSENKGFQTIKTLNQLEKLISEIAKSDLNYFSSMISKKKLGEIITIANKEKTDIAKAEKFLALINE
jgi:hypothetical protein